MQTYRALTFSEASFVHPTSRETVGTSFELRGTVDTDALRAALRAVIAEYPVLSAKIVTSDGAPHFAPGDPDMAAAKAFAVDDSAWIGYAQTPPSFVGSAQLVALTLTGRDDRHRLTLWASHAAADGGSMIEISLRLFERYTEYASGQLPAAPVAHEFPAAPHLVMADRGHLPGDLDYEQRLAGTTWHGSVAPAAAIDADAAAPDVDDVVRIRFTESDTSALAAAARAQGFSTHALTSALIARAELAECGDGAAVALLTPVDFRGRIDPPIPVSSVTALCGFSYVAVAADSVSSIARTVADQIRSDLRDGTVLRTAVSPMPDLRTRQHGAPVLISNLGAFPQPNTPFGLDVVDFHSQIVRSAAGIREYAASWPGPDRPPVPLGTSYLISTFGSRLSIELRALPGTLADQVRARILERIDTDARALVENDAVARDPVRQRTSLFPTAAVATVERTLQS